MIEITEKDFKSEKLDSFVKEELEKGSLFVFASESSYGFFGNALSEEVVKKIHKIKKEEMNKPVGIITDDVKKVSFLEIDSKGKKLLEKDFGAPLTILFKGECPCSSNSLVGVRIPKNKLMNKLCSLVKFPLTAPSANVHGEKPIFDDKKIVECFENEKIIFINSGKLEENESSTYYDFENEKVLREGKITLKKINNFLRENY